MIIPTAEENSYSTLQRMDMVPQLTRNGDRFLDRNSWTTTKRHYPQTSATSLSDPSTQNLLVRVGILFKCFIYKEII